MKTVGRLRNERDLEIEFKADSGYHRQLNKVIYFNKICFNNLFYNVLIFLGKC